MLKYLMILRSPSWGIYIYSLQLSTTANSKLLSLQGRTFQTSIEYFLSKNKYLNEVLVEKYHSDKVSNY